MPIVPARQMRDGHTHPACASSAASGVGLRAPERGSELQSLRAQRIASRAEHARLLRRWSPTVAGRQYRPTPAVPHAIDGRAQRRASDSSCLSRDSVCLPDSLTDAIHVGTRIVVRSGQPQACAKFVIAPREQPEHCTCVNWIKGQRSIGADEYARNARITVSHVTPLRVAWLGASGVSALGAPSTCLAHPRKACGSCIHAARPNLAATTLRFSRSESR